MQEDRKENKGETGGGCYFF